MTHSDVRAHHRPDRGADMSGSARDVLVALLISSYPDLKRRLTGRLGSAEAANEALQDTYVRLQRTEIQGELRNPRSYLITMAINIASNRVRSEARHLSATDIEGLLEIADESPDPLRIAEARSELAAVERALQALPSRRRAMFRRFWVENADYGRIASDFNVSERTVRHELLLATRYLHAATEEIFVADLQRRLSQVSPQ
ncbi:RNA polymerase sigma factor [Sphingomonas sp. KR3-1]|uniref:RNA polymerase sigma factor n=1 Tax=Sphingomonas sp. KR3-1 TaxID=3156611 RepID=UPI0032B4634D